MRKTGTFSVDVKPGRVSWIFEGPRKPKGLVVLAHGAGANMLHSSMEDYARLITELDHAVFRFNFPYLEEGKGGPNRPPVLMATIRQGIERAREVYLESVGEKVPRIYLAGKSMGGRMGSLAEAEGTLGVDGLIYFGFPLHAAGKKGVERAAHLADIQVPMLFLQGTRDTLAQVDLIGEVVGGLPQSTLAIIEGGDHSFKVLKRSERRYEDALLDLKNALDNWMAP